MSKFIDLTGQRFGRLTVVSRGPRVANQQTWIAACDCGRSSTPNGYALRRGLVSSCGCKKIENLRLGPKAVAAKGNRYTHPLFDVWQGMVRRCHDPKSHNYAEYGGRGISVCERWRSSFWLFVEDIGPRPDGSSIDRFPDNNGNYEPSNSRWASSQQQGRNRRTNRLLEFNGETLPVAVWAERIGIRHDIIRDRLRYGWGIERALTAAPRPTRYKGTK